MFVNIVYVATCLVFIWLGAAAYQRSARQEKRTKIILDLIENLIPRVFPEPARGEDLPEPNLGIVDPNDILFKEYLLRDEVCKVTTDILKSNCFSTSYAEAYAKAEDIVVGSYALKDQPLSEKLIGICKGAQPERTNEGQN